MMMDPFGAGMTSQRTRTRMIERLRTQGIRDERVLAAMASVPRHLFVSPALAHRAYEDTALPLILGQTISQPYVVARMTEALLKDREALGRTLDVGCGCGYQAAVLANLTRQVFSIERIGPLLLQARDNLEQAGLRHVRLKHGDGMLGMPEAAPFDSIVVAAAANSTPKALTEQLAPGGRLIIPLGGEEQKLRLIECNSAGKLIEKRLEGVKFVPLLPGVA